MPLGIENIKIVTRDTRPNPASRDTELDFLSCSQCDLNRVQDSLVRL